MAQYRIASLIFAVLLGFSGLAGAIATADLLPPEQAFRLSVKPQSANAAVLAWDIAQGYYLYRNKFKFTSKTAGVGLGEARFPAGEKKHDEYFGEMEIYRGHIEIALPVSRASPSLAEAELEITAQGCADAGVCFPPYKQNVLLGLPVGPGDAAPPELSPGNPLARLGQTFKGLEQDKLLPPEQAFRFSANVKNTDTLHVDWQIAPGYYLYRERFKFALLDNAGVDLGVVEIPHGEAKQEEQVVEVFHNGVGFDLPLKRKATGPATIRLQAKYQGCAEKGVCYPPQESIVSLDLPALDSAAQSAPQPPKAQPSPVAEQDRIAALLKDDSVWLVAASFFRLRPVDGIQPLHLPDDPHPLRHHRRPRP